MIMVSIPGSQTGTYEKPVFRKGQGIKFTLSPKHCEGKDVKFSHSAGKCYDIEENDGVGGGGASLLGNGGDGGSYRGQSGKAGQCGAGGGGGNPGDDTFSDNWASGGDGGPGGFMIIF